ncbi:MAG: metal-dependent transcriptional regulator [Chloroflexota bacterium]|nr:metal-dependent transcriptional regulator [Chloroflexota bacterium]
MGDTAAIRHSPQNYLAEAYRLAYYQDDHAFISTSSLADALGVSAPAVTRMIGRLKEAGYLDHEPYRGITLTPAGEQEALANIRRHRLVEVFLVEVLHFGWHEVHDDADALAEAVSDDLIRRIDAMTGSPRRCPHGEPIPTADGRIARVRDVPLNAQPAGAEYAVSRVNTHDIDKLKYLAELGLRPGTRFTLMSRAPFQGPLQLDMDGTSILLGHELAGVLRVCAPEAFELTA